MPLFSLREIVVILLISVDEYKIHKKIMGKYQCQKGV